jgi:hypothetical protein
MPQRYKRSQKGTASNSLSWAFMIAGVVTLPFYIYKQELILWTALLFASVLVVSFFFIQRIGGQRVAERKAA